LTLMLPLHDQLSNSAQKLQRHMALKCSYHPRLSRMESHRLFFSR
jgi:hypothetical protein